jgi:hypothetical protein
MNKVFVLTIQEPDCPVLVRVFSTQKGASDCAFDDAGGRGAGKDILGEISRNLSEHGYASGIDEVFYQIDECQVLH